MTTTTIFLSLVPASGRHVPKKNAVLRTSRGVRNAPHVVEAQRDYHRQAKAWTEAHPGFRPLTGPIDVFAEFVAPWESDGVCVPDLSNIFELVADAMQKVIYVNDAQIVRCTLAKVHGEQVKVHVTVQTVKGWNR